MKNVSLLIFITFLSLNLLAEIRINVIMNPIFSSTAGLTRIHEVVGDSLESHALILCGDVVSQNNSKATSKGILKQIDPDVLIPTDFDFYRHSFGEKILASNIICKDSLGLIPEFIIRKDSISVGIFSVYTPDYLVKEKNLPDISMDYRIKKMIRDKAESLSKTCNKIILFSFLSQIIDQEMVKDTPIDAVVSLDYFKAKDTQVNNGKTKYFSFPGKTSQKATISVEKDAIKFTSREAKF